MAGLIPKVFSPVWSLEDEGFLRIENILDLLLEVAIFRAILLGNFLVFKETKKLTLLC